MDNYTENTQKLIEIAKNSIEFHKRGMAHAVNMAAMYSSALRKARAEGNEENIELLMEQRDWEYSQRRWHKKHLNRLEKQLKFLEG